MSDDVETLLKELRAARNAMRFMRRNMLGKSLVANIALKRINATLRAYRKPVALPEVPNHE